jgi:hypothetical protein
MVDADCGDGSHGRVSDPGRFYDPRIALSRRIIN